MTKRLFIDTVGCQMNLLDSEMIVASLRKQGFQLVTTPADANTILLNTCSVRQHAEDKVYSALGRLRQWKNQDPQRVLGLLGCMAQKEQQALFQRVPFLDLVVGPGQLQAVPELIQRAFQGERQLVAVSRARQDGRRELVRRSHETFDPQRDPEMRPTPFQAYLRIQIGCDKFCTYCVVPMTRGPEQCRSPREIIEEAKTLADQGCLEIVLLGQTVNSYRFREGDRSVRLADLLEMLHTVDGIQRLKFVTNCPQDMSLELMLAVRDLPKCSPYLHLPMQSGSNRILQLMKRGYTVEAYCEMMARLRDTIPGAAVSSDFIVGFGDETEEEFESSVRQVREHRFKNSFIFKYSQREGTKAALRIPDAVPYDVKQRRNNDLLAVQNAISTQDNLAFVGRHVDVLIEGPSKVADKRDATESGEIQLMGRTHCDRIVVLEGQRKLTGRILPAVILDATAHTLFGQLAPEPAATRLVQLS